MGMKLTTYVGPFLECQKSDFDWDAWAHLLTDGRMEASEKGEGLILIPNSGVKGIRRDMVVDPHGSQDIARFDPADLPADIAAFRLYARDFIHTLDEANAWYRINWGVVPCWS